MDVAQRRSRSNPWTFEEVRAVYEARGFVLLDTVYVATDKRLRARCPAGHERAQRFDHFRAGHGCPNCRSERRWAGRRHDLARVTAEVEGAGYAEVRVWRDHQSRIRIAFLCSCGEHVETTYPHFRASRRRGCRICATPSGPENPRYTGTNERGGRNVPEYKAWCRAVFKRDGYKCARCAAGRRLNAHHIENFLSVPHLRTVVENGITLCKGCHVAFHARYGLRDNNRAQLDEFLRTVWA